MQSFHAQSIYGRWLVPVLALLFCAGLLGAPSASADEGWVIHSFAGEITVNIDGSLAVSERIEADFGPLDKHGIFREIPIAYTYNATTDRLYTLVVESVTDERGVRYQYDTTRSATHVRIKIGDPNTTITGRHTYLVRYTVKGALNPFSDHDELYWNVTGDWPVAIEQGIATVQLPSGAATQVACFQGALNSTEKCQASSNGVAAQFAATRPLPAGQGFTLLMSIPKGVVPEPKLTLSRKQREVSQYFEVTPLTMAGAGAIALLAMLGLGWAWWRFGRDRAFTSVYYLTGNSEERTRPLFAKDPPVLEFEPPDKLRPGEIGVLLDERADTLDCTATIVDLAVRGYLRIEEVHHDGLILGIGASTDWRFVKLEQAEEVKPYERRLLDGLFHSGSPVLLSSLKTRFHTYLQQSEDALYAESQQQGWFPVRPDTVRNYWRGIALGLGVLGGIMVWAAGSQLGAGLIFVPVVVAGVLLLLLAPIMPHRTARGSEALRRVLGFREYLVTAETHRQQFNEQRNIFATYLPYAMVFGCVDKWAKALAVLNLDPQEAVSGWYVGYGAMNFMNFSNNMSTFASQVSSVIVSTPGGSGSSGFSSGGGFSGGGGGGGGGGSW